MIRIKVKIIIQGDQFIYVIKMFPRILQVWISTFCEILMASTELSIPKNFINFVLTILKRLNILLFARLTFTLNLLCIVRIHVTFMVKAYVLINLHVIGLFNCSFRINSIRFRPIAKANYVSKLSKSFHLLISFNIVKTYFTS
jgi:hypothetical protein